MTQLRLTRVSRMDISGLLSINLTPLFVPTPENLPLYGHLLPFSHALRGPHIYQQESLGECGGSWRSRASLQKLDSSRLIAHWVVEARSRTHSILLAARFPPPPSLFSLVSFVSFQSINEVTILAECTRSRYFQEKIFARRVSYSKS